jgi:hypothetical protein
MYHIVRVFGIALLGSTASAAAAEIVTGGAVRRYLRQWRHLRASRRRHLGERLYYPRRLIG